MLKATVRIALLTTALVATHHSIATERNSDAITKALATPDRTDADRERDQRDHPQAVLSAAGFGAGMTIADVFGGSGYYSQILSDVVGKDGSVLLVNNPPYDAYVKEDLDARREAGGLDSVDYSVVPNEDLGLETESLDGALIIMSYHDLFYADPDNGWPGIDADDFMDQIVTALKPGGKLLIVDHAAKPSSGTDASQTLHRIDEGFAKDHLTGRGLRFLTSLDVLRNPGDERTASAFDPVIRGKTDRFVHYYVKP